jgi:hypothetical protein
MDTSLSAKALALARSFVASPRDILPYLRTLPYWGRQPTDLELPWFSFAAIRVLQNSLNGTERVFEYGSGGSTFFFAHRSAQVLSVEDDPAWHGLVASKLARRGVTNAQVELHPMVDDERSTFLASSFSQRIRAAFWDVIVVDCHCGHNASQYGEIRPAALELAMTQLNPGGMIVLDDSWMFPQLLTPRPGWHIKDYVGCGPARYGVTSTAIFRLLS